MAKFNPKPFGKYFLIEKLATGGMAEIYKAKTFGVDGFEKLLAIKRILPHCSEDKEFITMLIDEAKLSVLLSHTNIVQVYDLGKVGDDYFISMEFIDGINLREILNRCKEANKKLPDELVLYVISEVCKGLDYAHSKKDLESNPLNIIHRDISPQNILISYEGEVKIVDFGIAKAAMNVSHTMAGILKGKISYMSPEQALGKPIDNKTDIFSAGLMLYELLTGDKLFTGDTQFEVLKKIRTTRINEKSFSDPISEPVRKIMAKALTYSTKGRYENAGDFQIDLTRHLYTTYPDFTPRRLAKLMKELFADEIEHKKTRETKAPPVEAQTASVMVSGENQEEIVHRVATSEQTITGAGTKQPTQTFIDTFVKGKEDMEVTPEPSITRTQQGIEEALTPKPKPPESRTPTPTPTPASLPPTEEIKKKKKGLGKIFYPLAAMLLVGVGLWGYFKTDWFKGAPPPEPKVFGVLQIHSTPEGAQIILNDSETNLVTPASVKTLEVGEPQKITLKKPKHKDWSKTITLLDINPVTLNPSLEVIPVGSIKVATTPPGAKILLNGEDTGKVSPTTLEDLPLNQTYDLRLEKDKHRPAEEKITLYSIVPIDFKKKLEEIKFANVKVTSNPTGARIYVDNNNTGQNTPAMVSNLEVGKRYTIRLSRTGYRNVTRSIQPEKEGTTNLRENLVKIEEKPQDTTAQEKIKEAQEKLKQMEAQKEKEKEQAKETAKTTPKEKEKEKEKEPAAKVAHLSVSSSPRGADVFINGVRRGSAPGKFKVKPGSPLEITVSKRGLNTVTKVVTLRPGETRNLGTIKLKGKEAAGAGIIVIDSNPPGAMVLMNGKPQKKTPLRVKGLRPGTSYTFTVKKSGYKTWSRSVTIGEGSKSFMANLKKL